VAVSRRRCKVCGVTRYVPIGEREPCPYTALHRRLAATPEGDKLNG
jgi:hypothetical protein